MGGVIDSFFVALGYKIDPKGLKEFQGAAEKTKESIFNVGNALKVFATGALARGIAHVGSTFEQNQIQIAGFLSALGRSSDFNAGLQDAAGVIQQITKDAALLPGEAEDYIDVFKGGFPFVQGAMPGGSLQDITDFTNRLTAIGKTFGLDAGLIAREFDHMLSPGRGTAGLRLPLFRQLLPFMQKVSGNAHLTAESFNAMTAPDRLKLMQSTFASLQPMLDASATSFDAMAGAALSMVKQVTRLVTAPIFAGMKRGLDAINSAIFTTDGKLTEFGAGLVDIGRRIASFGVNIVKAAGTVIGAIGKIPGLLTVLKLALRPALALLAGAVIQKGIGWVLKLTKAMQALKLATMGPTLVLGALAIAFALVAEDVYGFFNGIDSVTGVLVEKWGPAIYLVIAALGALGVALGAVVVAQNLAAVQMAIGWAVAAAPIVLLLAGMALLVKAIVDITKHWEVFKQSLKLRAFQVGNFLSGGTLGHLADAVTGGSGGSFESQLRAELGNRIEGEDQQRALDAMGPKQEGYDLNKDVARMGPFQDPSRYGAAPLVWQKYEPPGAGSAAGAGGQTNITHVNVPQINIKSTDPQGAAKETARELTRLGQPKRAY